MQEHFYNVKSKFADGQSHVGLEYGTGTICYGTNGLFSLSINRKSNMTDGYTVISDLN